jgi:hypothetical protein
MDKELPYSSWGIVKGKGLYNNQPKRYMMRNNNGVITYHNFKKKIHTWRTKYGTYNIIKENGGTTIFYNVGREIEIDVMEHLGIDIDPKNVCCGYNF